MCDPQLAICYFLSRYNPCFQILALASLAMALIPIGYYRSKPFAREGITTTIGFQVILAV
jgi:hypothetical protein